MARRNESAGIFIDKFLEIFRLLTQKIRAGTYKSMIRPILILSFNTYHIIYDLSYCNMVEIRTFVASTKLQKLTINIGESLKLGH